MSSKRKNTKQAFNVYRGSKLVDTVFANGYDAEEMRRSLIGHDGYPDDIRVTVARRKTKTRATKSGGR